MQDHLPQGEPRLQKVSPTPLVATSYVDPCIVYLEATEKDEVPVLMALWARSSHEVREVGGVQHIKMTEVIALTGRPVKDSFQWNMKDGKTGWIFSTTHLLPEIVLTRDNSGWKLQGLPYRSSFQNEQPYGFQGSLRYISAEEDALLDGATKTESINAKMRRLDRAAASRASRLFFAQTVLKLAHVEWPSLINALAFCRIAQRQPKPRRPRPSLWRRVATAVLGKKLVGA